MNQVVTYGIVLKRINYQEADRIVTVLTKTHGKLTFLAKGVRKPKTKLAGGIELFATNQMTYIAGKGDISTLISARLHKNYDNIVLDLDRTKYAYEFIKLINKSIENNAGEEFYDLLEVAFEYLNDSKVALDIIRIWFGLQFLHLMGHSPNVEVAYEGKEPKQTDKFRFDVDKMNFVPQEQGNYSLNHLKLFKLALASDPVQLQRVVNIESLIPQTLNLVQILMISSGFNNI